MVVRGARRWCCFTIDGPFEVAAEDVWPKAKGSRVARPREALPMRFGSCEWGTRS